MPPRLLRRRRRATAPITIMGITIMGITIMGITIMGIGIMRALRRHKAPC
jgi:hypothetical protein